MSFRHNFDIDELYEDFIDDIVSRPISTLTRRSRESNTELNNALRINQELVNNMYSLRRFLEVESPLDTAQLQSEPNMLETNMFGTNILGASPYIRTFNYTSRIIPSGFNYNPMSQYSSTIESMFRNILEVMIDSRPGGDMEDVRVTLSENEFNRLESKKATGNETSKECNICMDNYKKEEDITILPCEHIFHKNCIKDWLCKEKVTCPVCRFDTREKRSNV